MLAQCRGTGHKKVNKIDHVITLTEHQLENWQCGKGKRKPAWELDLNLNLYAVLLPIFWVAQGQLHFLMFKIGI